MNLATEANAGCHMFECGCRGKIGHLSWDEAKRAARAMHKTFKKQFDAYSCVFCRKWHVGSRRKR